MPTIETSVVNIMQRTRVDRTNVAMGAMISMKTISTPPIGVCSRRASKVEKPKPVVMIGANLKK
jgi:hypothetical protein